MANRPRRIDWEAAKAFYVGFGPKRSYGEVSREFSVSTTSVGLHARRENWAEAAADADRQATDLAIQRAVRSRAQRVAKSLSIIDGFLDRFDTELDEIEVKASDMPNLVKLAELLEGRPTEITVEEMHSGFKTLLVVAVQFVPKDDQPRFLEAANAALGVSVGEAA